MENFFSKKNKNIFNNNICNNKNISDKWQYNDLKNFSQKELKKKI